MNRYVNSLMSILPGSNKPKRHIAPYPVSGSEHKRETISSMQMAQGDNPKFKSQECIFHILMGPNAPMQKPLVKSHAKSVTL